jgi:tetratricopeptide (TPR) repeat protein
MDEYARLGSGHPEQSLVSTLHRWLPPRWLRPVPYHLPRIPGVEGLSATIYAVVAVQDNATALSWLAEYFIEMGDLAQAVSVSQALERFFPSDLGALVARTRVEHTQGDAAGFAHSLDEIQASLARGDDSTLPWERRVSLAIALTEGKRFELAKEQTKQCLATIDEARVRSLTTVSLYRLQEMGKAFGLGISDPQLRTLARGLLPVEMRDNL